MKKKYLIIPDIVKSKNDGDVHFIGARQLMRLYNVPPYLCVVQSTYGDYLRWRNHLDNLVILRPRYDGNYHISDKTRKEVEGE